LLKSKELVNIDSGILLFNKPTDMTSNFAIQWLKRSCGFRKLGHCGTLDPIATGLLIVCLGSGTRLSSYFTSLDKEYIAHIKLGEETDSHDRAGTVKKVSSNRVSKSQLLEVLDKFRGELLQVPPLYSAIKVNGKRAYSYARDGKSCVLESRKVNIYDLSLISFDGDMFSVRVSCSKGTYIRSLARDIGRALGVYAHLFNLTRTGIGLFSIYDKKCLSYSDILNSNNISRDCVIGLAEALYFIPSICVNEEIRARVIKGQKLDKEFIGQHDNIDAPILKLIDKDNNLIAIIDSNLRYLKVFPYEYI
jgi:tRNA pseudouridine55 synthase